LSEELDQAAFDGAFIPFQKEGAGREIMLHLL